MSTNTTLVHLCHYDYVPINGKILTLWSEWKISNHISLLKLPLLMTSDNFLLEKH